MPGDFRENDSVSIWLLHIVMECMECMELGKRDYSSDPSGCIHTWRHAWIYVDTHTALFCRSRKYGGSETELWI